MPCTMSLLISTVSDDIEAHAPPNLSKRLTMLNLSYSWAAYVCWGIRVPPLGSWFRPLQG